VLVHKNVKGNDFAYFLKLVEPYRHDLTVCSECTFNWYWLADACEDAGIEFVLAHALYLRAIHATKKKNDKIDSEKIAHLLRTNMIPYAYVYQPKRAMQQPAEIQGCRSHHGWVFGEDSHPQPVNEKSRRLART